MRRFCLPLLAVLLVLASPAQEDEAWVEGQRVRGTVLDSRGEPLAGARVTLARGDDSGALPAVETNARGRFAIQGAEPGEWKLTVEAAGHVSSHGRVTVRAGGPTPALRVQLRSLDEVSASGSEGNPSTIRGWLERGSSLLDQGLYVEARAEFEKALRELPPAEQPRVLQAIARTHYLQGDTATAIETLQRAVRLAPRNETLRELLRQVGVAVGDVERIERFLEQVDRPAAPDPGAVPGGHEETAQRRFELPEHPRLDPEPHRVGRYRTSFDKRAPLSGLGEYVKRSGIPLEAILSEDPEALDLTLEDEVFEVYVPADYDPGTPYGLFVWVSPTPYGGFEHPDTLAVLDRFRLIAVGANDSGNDRPRWDRYRLALEAAHHAKRLYNIDASRVWIGGYSGGGRMASGLHILYPEVFRGGFYFYGCDHFLDMPLPDRPGARWTAGFPRPARPILKRLKQEHRFVLLTGTRDFNRLQTRATYESLRALGFRHVTYLEIPEASHYTRVGPEWLTLAFSALDGDESP